MPTNDSNLTPPSSLSKTSKTADVLGSFGVDMPVSNDVLVSREVQDAIAAEAVNVAPASPSRDDALLAMQAEIQALKADQNQTRAALANNQNKEDSGTDGYPWMYWRRRKDKSSSSEWIQVGPGGRTPNGGMDTGAYQGYVGKGMTPVTGYTQISNAPEIIGTADAFVPILANGGAKEFPLSQVLAHKWHISPPIAGLVFPQYEAVKDQVLSFSCEVCGDESYAPPGDTKLGEIYRSHLVNSHKYSHRDAVEAVQSSNLEFRPFAKANAKARMPLDREGAKK